MYKALDSSSNPGVARKILDLLENGSEICEYYEDNFHDMNEQV